MSQPPPWLVKRVLLGPAAVRRAAAARLPGKQERWMLRQATAVRRSYVREVVERGGGGKLEQAWMLRQPDQVRHSYAAEVLGVE